MRQESHELWSFLRAIEANPEDVTTRRAFADWLLEHGEPEEAERQRTFDPALYNAEKWLRDFCKDYRADYAELLKSCASGEGYCFGDDCGPYSARQPEFWDNIEIVLKQKFDKEHRDNTDFRCAC